MNAYTAVQLAEVRRRELIADATCYRHARARRGCPRRHTRRPIGAFYGWLALRRP